jgi:acyl-CoA thioester hydrolase
MNLAYYVVIFDLGTDAIFDALDIGAAYTQRSGNTLFAVETHTLYEREVTLGERVRIVSNVVGGDAKRILLAHEMFKADGSRAAAFEVMSLNVDATARRVAPFPPDRVAAIAAMAAEDAPTRPGFVGRRIALPG